MKKCCFARFSYGMFPLLQPTSPVGGEEPGSPPRRAAPARPRPSQRPPSPLPLRPGRSIASRPGLRGGRRCRALQERGVYVSAGTCKVPVSQRTLPPSHPRPALVAHPPFSRPPVHRLWLAPTCHPLSPHHPPNHPPSARHPVLSPTTAHHSPSCHPLTIHPPPAFSRLHSFALSPVCAATRPLTHLPTHLSPAEVTHKQRAG